MKFSLDLATLTLWCIINYCAPFLQPWSKLLSPSFTTTRGIGLDWKLQALSQRGVGKTHLCLCVQGICVSDGDDR